MRVIAIDGPAGAGKSTVARQVSTATGLRYLDTGAMYRCVALEVQNTATDPNDADAVGKIAREVSVVIERDAAKLNGVDVSSEIRSSEINAIVSVIAAHTPVRDAMREQQRRWIQAQQGGVVEGRDIGTVVFPDAELKIFMNANTQVRALRRYNELIEKGQNVSFDEILKNVEKRDLMDTTRIDSPLVKATDAIEVNNSETNREDQFHIILQLAKDRIAKRI